MASEEKRGDLTLVREKHPLPHVSADESLAPDHPEKSARVYISLRDDIYARRWNAGSQFNIQTLADELKISRTPVREALIRLSVEQLVQFRPGKGFFAKARSSDEERNEIDLLFTILKGFIQKGVDHFTGEGLHQPSSFPGDNSNALLRVMFMENIYERIVAPTGNLTATRLVRALIARTTTVRKEIIKDEELGDTVFALAQELAIELESQNLRQALFLLDKISAVKINFITPSARVV